MGSPFQGGVPLGNGESAPTGQQAVSCIWHSHDLAHPPDAPPCAQIMHQGKPIWAMPLASLLGWLVVNLTQMLTITEAMAKHLNEVAVHVEGLEALLKDD